MKLRGYQESTIERLRETLAGGARRPVVMAPTGAGKTIIAASIVRMAREKGKRVIFTVPAISLIDQTVERFHQNGIYEVGVMQGMHEMTDGRQPVQVCSVQTLARRKIPKADLVIVDECHMMFRLYDEWMNDPDWRSVPFVGLTATPWAKGMGAKGRWDSLVVATTTEELIKLGTLSDFKVFAPAHPDLSKVGVVAGDYKLDDLAVAMNKGKLVADIVSTWLDRGQDRPTICFAVNRTHAANIAENFIKAGVKAEYMDALTPLHERNAIVRRFANGDTKVICNVGVLTTGFDADVRCIILARPTKSEILYTQMIGRGLRTAKGKDHCLILDHSDTTIRLGFVTDIKHQDLDDGTRKQAKVREAKEALPKECPKCTFLRPPKIRTCPSCGFIPTARCDVVEQEGDLHEITRDKKVKATEWTMEQKQAFYSELILHAHQRGYKRGWAYWAYKDRFKVAPASSLLEVAAPMVTAATDSWIRARNIRKAKAAEKGRAVA